MFFIFMFIVLGVGMSFFMMTAYYSVEIREEKKESKEKMPKGFLRKYFFLFRKRYFVTKTVVSKKHSAAWPAVTIGLLTGVLNYFAPVMATGKAWSILFLIPALGIEAHYFCWWGMLLKRKNVTGWTLAAFIAMIPIIWETVRKPVKIFTTFWSNKNLTLFIRRPLELPIFVITFIVILAATFSFVKMKNEIRVRASKTERDLNELKKQLAEERAERAAKEKKDREDAEKNAKKEAEPKKEADVTIVVKKAAST